MGVEEAEDEFVKDGGVGGKGSGSFRPVPRGTEHVRMYLTICALSYCKQDGEDEEEGRKGRDEEVAANTPFPV